MFECLSFKIAQKVCPEVNRIVPVMEDEAEPGAPDAPGAGNVDDFPPGANRGEALAAAIFGDRLAAEIVDESLIEIHELII